MEPLDVMEAIEGFWETDKLFSLDVVDLEKGESELSEICTIAVVDSPYLELQTRPEPK